MAFLNQPSKTEEFMALAWGHKESQYWRWSIVTAGLCLDCASPT